MNEEKTTESLGLYGDLVRLTQISATQIIRESRSEKAQYNYTIQELSEAYSKLVLLHIQEAISKETFQSFADSFSNIQTEIKNEEPKLAIYNSINSLATKVVAQISPELAGEQKVRANTGFDDNCFEKNKADKVIKLKHFGPSGGTLKFDSAAEFIHWFNTYDQCFEITDWNPDKE